MYLSPLSKLSGNTDPTRQTSACWRYRTLHSKLSTSLQWTLSLCLPPEMSQPSKLVTHQQMIVEEAWETALTITAQRGLSSFHCLHLALTSPSALPLSVCVGLLWKAGRASDFCSLRMKSCSCSCYCGRWLISICWGHVPDIRVLGGKLD